MRIRCFLGVTLLATGAAHADPDVDMDDIAGGWTFQTETSDGCQLGGNVVLGPEVSSGKLACELIARETCSDGRRFVVRQSCEAALSGDALTITSHVEEIILTTPGYTYHADHFDLIIESPDRMVGRLRSLGRYDTVFERDLDGLS